MTQKGRFAAGAFGVERGMSASGFEETEAAIGRPRDKKRAATKLISKRLRVDHGRLLVTFLPCEANSSTFCAKASLVNGFVKTCIPWSRCPWLRTAFSA